MNKKNLAVLLGLGLLLNGCMAHMEQAPGSVSSMEYGPVNMKEQPGLISYNKSLSGGPKKDAYKQMYKVCNGKYKIIRQFSKSDGAVFIPYGTYGKYGGSMIDSEKEYIEFKCVK